MKCSASKIDFNSLSFDPVGLVSPPYRGIKCWVPHKTRYYCTLCCVLIPEVAHSRPMLSRVL